MFSEALTFDIVYLALAGIFIKPLFILWLVSLCLARRKSDPVRMGFLWMKFVFPLEVIALTLDVLSGVAAALLQSWSDDDTQTWSSDVIDSLNMVNVRTGSTGTLFEHLADVFLIFTFAELGIGFLRVLDQKSTGFQKAIRYSAFAVGGILFVLSLAWCGKLQATWTQYFDYLNDSRSRAAYLDVEKNLKIARKIGGAIDILFWITSILMIIVASFVVHRHSRMLLKSAILLLVATILNFVRHTWLLVYAVRWSLNDNAGAITYAVYVVEPLCNIWPMFVLLVLLFVLSIRKREGLWSTQQPWGDNQPVMYPYMQQQQMYQPYPPQQQQQIYQPYPPQQTTYVVPPQQGLAQQPAQQYIQELEHKA